VLEDVAVEAEVGERFAAFGFRETGSEGFLERGIAFHSFVEIGFVFKEDILGDRLHP